MEGRKTALHLLNLNIGILLNYRGLNVVSLKNTLVNLQILLTHCTPPFVYFLFSLRSCFPTPLALHCSLFACYSFPISVNFNSFLNISKLSSFMSFPPNTPTLSGMKNLKNFLTFRHNSKKSRVMFLLKIKIVLLVVCFLLWNPK